MRLEYFFLADKAEAIGGKLYLLGGGWDTLNLAGTPAIAAYDMVASVAFSPDEAGTHEITFELIDPDGQVALGPLGGAVEAPAREGGDVIRLLIALGGPFPQIRSGAHRWRITVDGKVAGEVQLTVVVTGEPAAGSAATA